MPHRTYQVEYLSEGRRSGGNLYETWRRLGFSLVINAWQRSYLKGAALPAYRLGSVTSEDGSLHLNCVVEPHDVILIRLTPDK